MNWLWNVFFFLLGILAGMAFFTVHRSKGIEKDIKRLKETERIVKDMLREIHKKREELWK